MIKNNHSSFVSDHFVHQWLLSLPPDVAKQSPGQYEIKDAVASVQRPDIVNAHAPSHRKRPADYSDQKRNTEFVNNIQSFALQDDGYQSNLHLEQDSGVAQKSVGKVKETKQVEKTYDSGKVYKTNLQTQCVPSKEDDPAARYTRRSRHKIKPEKYDYKGTLNMTTIPVSDVSRRKRQRHPRKKSGAALNHEFNAMNVQSDRVSLRPRLQAGILAKGKSSIPTCDQKSLDLPSSNSSFADYVHKNLLGTTRNEWHKFTRTSEKANYYSLEDLKGRAYKTLNRPRPRTAAVRSSEKGNTDRERINLDPPEDADRSVPSSRLGYGRPVTGSAGDQYLVRRSITSHSFGSNKIGSRAQPHFSAIGAKHFSSASNASHHSAKGSRDNAKQKIDPSNTLRCDISLSGDKSILDKASSIAHLLRPEHTNRLIDDLHPNIILASRFVDPAGVDGKSECDYSKPSNVSLPAFRPQSSYRDESDFLDYKDIVAEDQQTMAFLGHLDAFDVSLLGVERGKSVQHVFQDRVEDHVKIRASASPSISKASNTNNNLSKEFSEDTAPKHGLLKGNRNPDGAFYGRFGQVVVDEEMFTGFSRPHLLY